MVTPARIMPDTKIANAGQIANHRRPERRAIARVTARIIASQPASADLLPVSMTTTALRTMAATAAIRHLPVNRHDSQASTGNAQAIAAA
jgi:hypothetical protein